VIILDLKSHLQNGKSPKISIVMASYNYEKYIAEAIESVLNQTVSNFELIIIDDASKDNSKEIIKEYAKKDDRVFYLLHEKNKGLYETSNEGLSLCRGEYIAFIDSDDIWEKNKLIKQLDIFEEKQSVEVIYTDAETVDEKSQPLFVRFSQKYCAPTIMYVVLKLFKEFFHFYLPELGANRSGNIFPYLLRSNWICKSSAIFRTKHLRNVRFRKDLKLLNDWIFWLDLASKYEFYYIPNSLTRYRIQQTSMTSVSASTAWDKDLNLVDKIRRYYFHLLPMHAKIRFIVFFKLLNGSYWLLNLCNKDFKHPLFGIPPLSLKKL
jgi:glycosyltransferase involved in cell wall biosynthesis